MTRINLALRRKRPIDSGVASFAGICAGALLGAGIWVLRRKRPIDSGVASFAGICLGALLGAAMWVIIGLAVWAIMGGLEK